MWPGHVLDMTLFTQSVHLLPVSCVDFLCTVCLTQSPGEAWRDLVTSVCWNACSLCILFVCLCSANVTIMRLSGLVAEAEQTIWCRREQSEGLAQISPNTQGRFIINISEKKQSIDARAPGVFTENTRVWGWWRWRFIPENTRNHQAIIPTVRKSPSPF